MYGSCEEADAAASENDIRTAFQRFLGVMADAGLRRSEAAALTWTDIEFWPDSTARITIRKGG